MAFVHETHNGAPRVPALGSARNIALLQERRRFRTNRAHPRLAQIEPASGAAARFCWAKLDETRRAEDTARPDVAPRLLSFRSPCRYLRRARSAVALSNSAIRVTAH